MSTEIAPPPLADPTGPAPDRPLPALPTAWRNLAGAFVATARARPNDPAMADSTGTSLNYGATFLRAVALGRVLSRLLGPEPYTGILIPPTVHGALANVALTLLGKVPVNLHYTASQGLVDASIDQAGIAHVLTSRRVIDKFKIKPKGTLIYLEDLPKQVTTPDKVFAAMVAKVVPSVVLAAFLPGLRRGPTETATIIFTSGSTGDPKGVVLSNGNILSNIQAIRTQVHLHDHEVVLGILPFFHAFGFTVTIWTVMALGKQAVYHFSPLDARIIGNLSQEHKATVLFATPTFLRSYLKKCDKEQFATMWYPVVGAEKLKPELAREIQQGLGIEPMEGFGCTELSPVVAVNVPHDLTTPDGRTVPGHKLGTVGMPLPGTAIKTTHIETGAELPRGAEGIVHVKGPQVMQGYLNRPDATAKVLNAGWYCTGDLGFVDEDGFLTITGRLSRFSKIGGEMVPHERVEAAIAEAAGVDDSVVAVTALPDPKRGERLVVVHTELPIEPAEVCRRLVAGSLPKLWLPSASDFIKVEALPALGTGKLDLRGLRRVAEERLGQPAAGD
jgi:acyl-[acyl-carrier-protein]-phospholipid O-acyltransferase/long-chain-fatty-acid--[acyl-carrier-protein] ligase